MSDSPRKPFGHAKSSGSVPKPAPRPVPKAPPKPVIGVGPAKTETPKGNEKPPEPAPVAEPVVVISPDVKIILGKDVEGWIAHLKGHETPDERRIAIYCLTLFNRRDKTITVLWHRFNVACARCKRVLA